MTPDDQIKDISQKVIDRNQTQDQFGVSQTPFHTHNGSDSPQLSQTNIIPGVRASGNITFSQSTSYKLGITFNPTLILFYGNAVRRDYIFTVTAANATVGATYTNNGQTFTVLSTIAGTTTLTTVGTGNPAASGTLTKTSGTGDATITFSAFAHNIEVRVNCTGSAQIGRSFYFQPQSSTSVQTGGTIQNVIQSASMFLVDSSTNPLTVRTISGEGHIVEVEYSVDYGATVSTIVARSTISGVNPSYVTVDVLLATGWEINGNYVIT